MDLLGKEVKRVDFFAKGISLEVILDSILF
jgi:hypothetical protein